MKIYSWNVNGIRAGIRNGFNDWLKKTKPDVVCLQEIKIDSDSRAKETFDWLDYAEYWNSADRKGYSGTAILVKNSFTKRIKSYKEGVGITKFDTEGRVQNLEFDKFYLLNIYYPNTKDDLSRLDFKQEFNKAIRNYVKKLEKKKPVIVTGDYNVAHEEIDLKNPQSNKKNAGFTPEERSDMTKFIEGGMVDTFRAKHPKKIQYSWWSYRFGARKRNVGWRIDYFCVSKKFFSKVKKAEIHDQVMGSDHCPIFINIEV